MNLRVRCENCNLQDYTEIKKQPSSSSFIPSLFRLKIRTYVHCIACGHIEDMKHYTQRMNNN